MNTETEQKLISEITAHDVAYYVHGHPTVTDYDYDQLMKQLKQVESELGRALPNSPTQRVGSDLSGAFAKVKHERPMLSLENVFSPDDVSSFYAGSHWTGLTVVEAKIDGLAVELRYRAGLLTQAITRGDGSIGDDVTANVRAIRSIPLSIENSQNLSVRGEIYMRRSVFSKLNADREKAGEEPMANPRNAAAGSVKLKNPAEVAKRNLSFIAYWCTISDDFTQHEMTTELHRRGFPTLLTAPLKPAIIGNDTTTPLIFSSELGNESELSSAIENIRVQRDDLDMDIDGAVIKINSRARQTELGNKNKSPYWACAFKFPPERQATELLNIEITVGRSGQITPNARLKPVQLSGTTVENASLMNADELERIGNPGIGDIVWVEKSAEIIPRVVGIKERRASSPWQFPDACSCGIGLERRGVHWFCNNPACEERVYQRVKHATSKGALDWDGMGESQVRGLIHKGQGILQRGLRLSDLFTLDPNQLGLKPAALKKFLVERERVKTIPLWRKLVSLGIEDVGQTLSKEIAMSYGSLDGILTAIEVQETHINQPGILDLMGPVAHGHLVDFLKAEVDDLQLLIDCGFNFVDEARIEGPLTGKIIVITGTLTSGTRDVVAARIEAAGGLVKSSVGRKTTYLLTGEQPGGEKTSAAQKYGIQVITEKELYGLLGIAMPSADLPDFDNM